MDMNKDKDGIFAGNGASIFGAIFMSNRHTKKECLKRKLFGLPLPQANFVKKIKAGMVLFLFEYEERKLYGVFQASSDGSMNIVPHAFKSSGKEIPAQILFKTIWYCNPLSEQDFCDAIKENYYTPKKFNLGLSENQVYKLLCLFNSRKLGNQKSQNLFPVKKFKSYFGSSELGRCSVFENDGFTRTEHAEQKIRMGNKLVDLVRYPGPFRSNPNLSGISNKLKLEADSSIVEGQHRLSSLEPQSVDPLAPICLKSRRDLDYKYGNSHCYNDSTISSSWPGHSSFSRSQVIPSYVEAESLNMSSMRPRSLNIFTGPEDFIPLPSPDHLETSESSIFFPETCSRSMSIVPSNLESYKDLSLPGVLSNLEDYSGLSFPDPSEAIVPFARHADFGMEKKTPSFNPAYGPSCVSDHHYLALSRHGYDYEGSKYLDREHSNSRGVYPLDSYTDSYEGVEKDSQTNKDNDIYVPQMCLHSDIQKNRTSVFSRLTMSKEATEQDDDDKGNNMDISVQQLMDALYKGQKDWRRSIKKSEHNICLKDNGSSKFDNIEQLEVAACASEEQQEFSDMIVEEIEVPINFKRRSKVQKVQGKMGGFSEESEGSLGMSLRKRRKLVRPSFVMGETHDKGVTDNLHGSQEIIEAEGHLGSGVRSDNAGGSQKALPHKFSAEAVVCPGGFGGDNGQVDNVCGNQDFKVRVEAIVQELVDITNCPLTVEGSSQDGQNCCEGDFGKAEVGFDMSSVKSEDDGKTKGFSPQSQTSLKADDMFDMSVKSEAKGCV